MSSQPPPIADPEDLLGTYAFLPWLRTGLANAIVAPPASGARASIHVEVDINGVPVAGGPALLQTASRDVALYGPGDILGIDARAVIRTEPRAGVSNFESNYMAAIDFYDEDFPWRYTPAPPAGLQLSPWIALVVLKKDEFDEGRNLAKRPLPFITLAAPQSLPTASELWAWAHVHFNQGLSVAASSELVSSDMNAVIPRVQSILDANPDLAYSRLLCPRLLDVNTSYDAFVVPVFESGRLAGLGFDPAAAPSALASAWAPYAGQQEPKNLPYYYRWSFGTGDRGDFRYLVGLLKPQPVDPTVGTRDFDSQAPGSGLPGTAKPGLNGVLRLGGALEVPDADLSAADKAVRDAYENWDQPAPDPFVGALASFINLPDDYATQTPADANAASAIGPGISDDPDPLITLPLYGRWHALTQRLLTQRDGTPAPNAGNWLHRLNLDPRLRIPASYGAEVVEANAEQYMNYAWEQIGDVLQANQSLRRLHFATAAASRLYARHLLPSAALSSRVLSLTAPVASRVLFSGLTVASLRGSATAPTLVPPVLSSTVMRRVLRPGGRLMRTLPFTASASAAMLLERINAGEVASAPVKTVPAGAVTIDQAVAAIESVPGGSVPAPPGPPPAPPPPAPPSPPSTSSPLLLWLASLPRWALWLLAIVLILLALSILGPLLGGIAAVAIIVVVMKAIALASAPPAPPVPPAPPPGGPPAPPAPPPSTPAAAQAAIEQSGQTAASIAGYPAAADFVLGLPGDGFVPTLGGSDSATGLRFNTALQQSFALNAAGKVAGQRPAPVALDLGALSKTVLGAVDPKTTILRRGLSRISLPPWVVAEIGEDFNEVMAYPKIDLPMYQPLEQRSAERLLPNIGKIARNSLTLMETNQRFIEAYMVGLNHEFARKLLWREYPTDQRGSYFRQFWSVGDAIDDEGLGEDALKEKRYDIPEIHRWAASSKLGEHNNRIPPGQPASPQAVLIIRGELLKKYPNTVIFAQHARMNGGLREPDWLTAAEEQNPPHAKTRTPLYQARPVDDIFFFGFDLTIDEAKGSGGDPGWYFVLQERPGEARFGLELSRAEAAETFDDLAWSDALPGIQPGQFLPAGALATVPLAEPSATSDAPKHDQWLDDRRVGPAAASSARWAYLLLRQPVMVAVHADEMLAS